MIPVNASSFEGLERRTGRGRSSVAMLLLDQTQLRTVNAYQIKLAFQDFWREKKLEQISRPNHNPAQFSGPLPDTIGSAAYIRRQRSLDEMCEFWLEMWDEAPVRLNVYEHPELAEMRDSLRERLGLIPRRPRPDDDLPLY